NSPAQVIAFYRLFIASCITLVILLGLRFRDKKSYSLRDFTALNRREIILLVSSGFFLSLHFYFWIYSIDLTTVALSTLFVDSSPLFVILFAFLILKEKINIRQIAGFLIALTGVIILFGSGFSAFSEDDFIGIAMALIGAVTVAFYVVIGRQSRSKLGMWHYTLIVYSSCTFFLFVICLIDVQSLLAALIVEELVVFFLLAVLGSILGHSLYNYSLKYVKGATVSICFLGEAVGASIYAIFVFSEIPSTSVIIGGLVMIIGIIVTVIYENEEK
ncbi:MAG: DMT family transporter, partial [Candidatus Hodarchaeales archaeon]